MIAVKASIQKIEREMKTFFRDSKKNHHPMLHYRNSMDQELACSETGFKKIRKNFIVSCENTEDDKNWIVIQNRFDGDINFFRNWKDYKDGFGNIGGEFWMGLEKIHELTSNNIHELMITIEDFDGEKKIAKYSAFSIASEDAGYAMNLLGKYSGDAGDALSYHAGMKFSTYE